MWKLLQGRALDNMGTYEGAIMTESRSAQMLSRTKEEKIRDMTWTDRFPRSGNYDIEWMLKNEMGPNALWLTEWLSEAMDLRPGMRVLDLGCGKAVSSIFLAREFDVEVWAIDLWLSADDIMKQIDEAGLGGQIVPIHADARSLPFAHGYFDAIVCVDSYIYFGTDDLYLKDLVRFVKADGQIGIVVPALTKELEGPVPDFLKPFWSQECWSFHPAEWWHRLWARTGLVDVESAENMAEGWELWRRWAGGADAKVVAADRDKIMSQVRMVARRKTS